MLSYAKPQLFVSNIPYSNPKILLKFASLPEQLVTPSPVKPPLQEQG